MKRILPILLCLLLVLSLSMTVWAEDSLTIQITSTGENSYVVDNGELLSDSEEQQLNTLAQQISQKQGNDVVLLTVDGLDGKTAMEYADDYFDYNGYGQGADRSGLLLLLSMEDRDWWISTRGNAIQAFTDDGIQYAFSKAKDRISNGDYSRGFQDFLSVVDTMLSAYNGTLSEEELEAFQADFDSFRGVRQKPGIIKTTLIALVVGFLIAFIPSAGLRSQLKSVRANYDATNYRRPDSMHLDRNRDIYLYANTPSRVIETQRSGGGGGSSTHVSSSGATHGGGGGKF